VRALAAAVALLLVLAGAAAPQTTLPDVEDEVMCVECGTALNVSTSAVADQERQFIRDRIAEGRDKEEIKALLVQEYGPDVLAEPKSSLAWLVPAALAAAALIGVLAVSRRWRRGRGPGSAPPSGPDLDPAEARRLDAELAAFER
jgi:cytochrome c-type biogenesis protein CcmH